jgi:hypothetical protein
MSNMTSSWVQIFFPRGRKLNYTEGNMEWFDCSIPICPPWGLDLNKFDAMEDMFLIKVKDELFGDDWLKCFETEILDARYERTDVVEVVKWLTHLNAHQKADLLWALHENDKMFNGPPEVYPHKWYTLTLIQMPSLCILDHTLYLKSIWKLSKQNWTTL